MKADGDRDSFMSICLAGTRIGTLLISLALLVSGLSCVSGSRTDAISTAEENCGAFNRNHKVKQVLVQTWDHIQLDDGRELTCSKSLNCMVMGEEVAEVLYDYNVVDHSFARGASRTLISESQRTKVASDILLDFLALHILKSDENARDDVVMISYMNMGANETMPKNDAFEEGINSANETFAISSVPKIRKQCCISL